MSGHKCLWRKIFWSRQSYYKQIPNVADVSECCGRCKEDSKCTHFSYGISGGSDPGNCRLEKDEGWAHYEVDFSYLSSTRDISSCSCNGGIMELYFDIRFMM